MTERTVLCLLCVLYCLSPPLRQAAWCLGNVAGEGTKFRDLLLDTPGALEGVLLNVSQAANPSLLRNVVWTLSNMCRGKPQPPLAKVRRAVPVLLALVATQTRAAAARGGAAASGDELDVLVDACWALSYLTDGDDARIDCVVSANAANIQGRGGACNGCGALVALLKHPSAKVVTPALRTVGNIVTAEDARFTQAALEAGLLAGTAPLLEHARANVRKEACWTLSNVTAGTAAQAEAVLAHDGGALLGKLLELLAEGQWDVRKEAAFAVANVCTSGAATAAHVAALATRPRHDVVSSFCEMLHVQDVKMVMVALEALAGVLAHDGGAGAGGESKHGAGAGGGAYALAVEECGGLDKIEALQDHANADVYKKSVHLLETYFGSEDEEEDQNVAPAVANEGKAFSFAAPANAAPGGFTFAM